MYTLQLIHRGRKRFLRLKLNDTSLLPDFYGYRKSNLTPL